MYLIYLKFLSNIVQDTTIKQSQQLKEKGKVLNNILYMKIKLFINNWSYTVPRSDDKNATSTLNKAMQYSQKAFEEAFAAKEAVLHIETTIKKFINEQTLRNKTSEDEASDTSLSSKPTRKKSFWYTVSVTLKLYLLSIFIITCF